MADREAHSDPTPFDPSEVLRIVDAAIDENAEWLQSWHRAIVCRETPDPRVVSEYAQYLSQFGSWMDLNKNQGLLDQSAFRELARLHEDMHQFGRLLALKSDQGHPIPAVEYDAFSEKVQNFNGQARRIREAFRRAQSELDPLTGLHNRQVMMTVLDRERERALRTGAGCCIVLADIDRFKSVNDTYGHAVGDFVLQTVAGRFLAKLRPYDEIFRYGGEEFLICLPDADAGAAAEVVERLRLSVADQPVPLQDGTALPVTVSFGLCLVDAENALKQTIEHADQALYAAKHGGRNQLRVWSEGSVR
ncbi:MAG: diguanylate cyclase [Rhodospirillaceae bacterium]|nr:diguanylate cyclase [Rhodospirillaceae bacterium]